MIPVPELEIEDADGTIYPLEWPGRNVLSVSGLGMPPIQHWTTRSPFRHGATHWGYVIQPRVINLALFSRGCTRSAMWQARAANCAMFNPLLGPHKLRLSYGGFAYELHDVWYNSGYELSSDRQTEITQTGAVQFICYDPFWKQVTGPLSGSQTRGSDGRICQTLSSFVLRDELQLAFVSPFLLGTQTAMATGTINNAGSWEVSPVLQMTGPADDWQLSNDDTGKIIMWDGYSLASGEIVTIDTGTGTATAASGEDMTIYLGGDVATFKLRPGDNDMTLFVTGGAAAGTTELDVCWYVEMLGT